MAQPSKRGTEEVQDTDATVVPRMLGSTPSQMAAQPQAGLQPAKAKTAKPSSERITTSVSQGKVMLSQFQSQQFNTFFSCSLHGGGLSNFATAVSPLSRKVAPILYFCIVGLLVPFKVGHCFRCHSCDTITCMTD